jgi:excisionase family DNA binding protein
MMTDKKKRSTMTTHEVAFELDMSVQVVRRWCRKGKLPAVRLGHEWKIRREDFEAMLQGKQQ